MIAACVTTRDEADTIRGLVARLLQIVDQVVVVDEQSTDGTPDVARDAGAYVQAWTGGIGPCLMQAWRVALRRNAEIIVQLDAGGSHDPFDAKRLLDVIWDSTADIAIGSRFLPDSHYEGRAWRRRASRAYAGMCNLATRGGITDWTSGFRAFNADTLNLLMVPEYRCRMHGWQAEVLRRALSQGMEVRETPISYKAGRSSLTWGVAREAVGLWFT